MDPGRQVAVGSADRGGVFFGCAQPGTTGIRGRSAGPGHGAIDTHVASGRVEKVPSLAVWSVISAVAPFADSLLANELFACVWDIVSWSRGGDAYLLKWVVHDWADKEAVQILKNCRSNMAPNGRILLIEFVLPQGAAASSMFDLDMTMLVFTGSRERTESEYAELLQRAGLKLLTIHPTTSAFSILEAVPV